MPSFTFENNLIQLWHVKVCKLAEQLLLNVRVHVL